jgi:hypothetical protein
MLYVQLALLLDDYLNPNDAKEILNDLGGLPGTVLLCVGVGGLLGYGLASLADPLPGIVGVLLGMGLGLIIAVGVYHAAPPPASAPICKYALNECQSPLTPGTFESPIAPAQQSS